MQVQTEALSRALKLLIAAKCSFAVIDADGTKHGDLIVVPPKVAGQKRHRNHPVGTFLRHHEKYTSTLQAGDSVKVPLGPFTSDEDRESMRSSVSGYAARTWGAGNCITGFGADYLEVLRIE